MAEIHGRSLAGLEQFLLTWRYQITAARWNRYMELTRFVAKEKELNAKILEQSYAKSRSGLAVLPVIQYRRPREERAIGPVVTRRDRAAPRAGLLGTDNQEMITGRL